MNKKLLMSLAIFSSTFVASELTSAQEAEASTKKPTTYKLTGSAATYTNAANAAAGVKAAKKTYAAGNYYVYKTASNGMINITTQAGKPGAWINPNGGQLKAKVTTTTKTPSKATTTTAASKPKTTTTTQATQSKASTNTATKTQPVQATNTTAKSNLYVLNSTAKTYTNAANAAAGVNAKSTYAAGNYYIYRTANNGMLNISRTQGKVGAWINPADNMVAATKASTKVQAAPAQQKATTSTNTTAKKSEPAKTTPKATETKAATQETYVLTTNVNTYTNAANAAAGKNSKSTYGQGTYYVFRSANGMLNISRTKGKVGAWINPAENKAAAAKSEPAKTNATTTKKEEAKTTTKVETKKTTKTVEKQKSGVRTDYGNYSKIIYLDAGHGGSDPGAMYYGLKEKDLNLSIYNKLSTQLKKQGYTVMARRTGDTNATLQQISEGANKSNADLFISIHFNASSNKNVRGIETYWYQDYAEYPSKLNKDNHTNPDRLRRSQILANGIHSNMVKNTGAADRGVRRDTYSVLRETAIPAVLLELGYMSNKEESSWISKSSYQDKLVDGIVKGINNYYEKA